MLLHGTANFISVVCSNLLYVQWLMSEKLNVYIYMYIIHTYIHTYTHTHTYIYIYIYIQFEGSLIFM